MEHAKPAWYARTWIRKAKRIANHQKFGEWREHCRRAGGSLQVRFCFYTKTRAQKCVLIISYSMCSRIKPIAVWNGSDSATTVSKHTIHSEVLILLQIMHPPMKVSGYPSLWYQTISWNPTYPKIHDLIHIGMSKYDNVAFLVLCELCFPSLDLEFENNIIIHI